jgi:hypothetical protein
MALNLDPVGGASVSHERKESMRAKLRASITGALIVSVIAMQTPLFASTEPQTSPKAPAGITQRIFSDTALANAVGSPQGVISPWPSGDSRVLAQRYYGRRGGGRRSTAMAAIVLGSAAAIAGGALLAYANRPECSANPEADGCGYGFKVVGGSVLAGGLVGVTLGALTWPH